MLAAGSTLIIGTRDSRLAIIQSEYIAANLLKFYPELNIEFSKIKSQGDLILDQPLYEIFKSNPNADLKGLFSKELEKSLLDETIDIAVHSMKDLPTTLPEGLEIACTSAREDIRDVVCLAQRASGRGLQELRTLGTSSPRRIGQLQRLYPQLKFVDIRGNLATRFQKLDANPDLDAIVLAAAGLKRQGLTERISAYLDPREVLPAVGQGALAVEIKTDSPKAVWLRTILSQINSHRDARIIQAERAFLRALGGGCSSPVGIYAEERDSSEICLMAGIFSLDLKQEVQRASIVGEPSEELGLRLAELLSQNPV